MVVKNIHLEALYQEPISNKINRHHVRGWILSILIAFILFAVPLSICYTWYVGKDSIKHSKQDKVLL